MVTSQSSAGSPDPAKLPFNNSINLLNLSKQSTKSHMQKGIKQNIKKENGSYFLTLTVIDWIDIFTRETYSKIVIETLKYSIKKRV